MTALRRAAQVALGFCLLAGGSPAQAAQGASSPAAAASGTPWSFSASAFGYFLPDESDYAQPTLAADRGHLHLEARYGYENHHTGSAWAGYNLAFGHALQLELTPMVGVVFGDTDGFAPGCRASLSWRRLDLSSESEYVFDAGDSANSFFYNWSELGWTPVDWLRLGVVVQRTRVYETERDVQRGVLLGLAYRSASLTAYVFNPDDADPTLVVGASLEF